MGNELSTSQPKGHSVKEAAAGNRDAFETAAWNVGKDMSKIPAAISQWLFPPKVASPVPLERQRENIIENFRVTLSKHPSSSPEQLAKFVREFVENLPSRLKTEEQLPLVMNRVYEKIPELRLKGEQKDAETDVECEDSHTVVKNQPVDATLLKTALQKLEHFIIRFKEEMATLPADKTLATLEEIQRLHQFVGNYCALAKKNRDHEHVPLLNALLIRGEKLLPKVELLLNMVNLERAVFNLPPLNPINYRRN